MLSADAENWQSGFYDHVIALSAYIIKERLMYIDNGPVYVMERQPKVLEV